MQPLFSTNVIEQIAAADSLLAFDFDGTLAPIVPDPGTAAMRSTTRHLLAQLAQLYPCMVVSGRPEEDVLKLLSGVTVWYVIGNRCLQPPELVARLSLRVAEWRPLLAERLAGVDGVFIEDKGVSLAVHYRKAANPESARAAIGAAAAGLEGARVIPGKELVNLLPEGGPDKGVAVDRIRSQLGSGAAGRREDVSHAPRLPMRALRASGPRDLRSRSAISRSRSSSTSS
jgi:trehalose 6-phosphate phosphatase